MSRVIKPLRNNRKVIFESGNFDEWCVFVVEENGKKKAPYDVEYFTDLNNLSKKYETDKVYIDFVAIYDRTNTVIDQSVLNLIDEIVETYEEEDRVIVEQWLTVLYGGMIAEENKEFAILKKRIKRLGMHQILKLGMSPNIAAYFSRGRKWRQLDDIMKPLGF